MLKNFITQYSMLPFFFSFIDRSVELIFFFYCQVPRVLVLIFSYLAAARRRVIVYFPSHYHRNTKGQTILLLHLYVFFTQYSFEYVCGRSFIYLLMLREEWNKTVQC